ncbi:MAG: hypothetical protein CVV45_17970 [Spirochaetae bacterium HGW-Spirochaetae-10]|nr:MAG: hypothetical protein CVV45_17970 [Spirochaetae bacterium HGW-Spirochaetae-10]
MNGEMRFYRGLRKVLKDEIVFLRPVSRTGRIQATAKVTYESTAPVRCLWTRKRRMFTREAGGSLDRYVDIIVCDPRDLQDLSIDTTWRIMRSPAGSQADSWEITIPRLPVTGEHFGLAVFEVQRVGSAA